MERDDEFKAGDRNSGNGTTLETMEAQEGVFEDGQIRDTTGDIRPVKDGESYVYGDSRPDETKPSDTFTDISDGPMMTTTRESFPEAREPSAEFLQETSTGGHDRIDTKPGKDWDGGVDEAVLVETNDDGSEKERF